MVDLGERTGSGELDAGVVGAEPYVVVRVDEAGQYQPARAVDDPGVLPAQTAASASGPSQTIRPSRTASASAAGSRGSTVWIRALRRIMSAGAVVRVMKDVLLG